MISIKGLNKAEVLKALYDGSHIQGMGFMQAVPEGFVTVKHCQQLLDDTGYPYFDYLYGRVIKVDLSGDEFEERLYDRDNGTGAAKRVVDKLRKNGAPVGGECVLDLTDLSIMFGSHPLYPRNVVIRFGNMRSIEEMIRLLQTTKEKMEGV